jgi:hypothetical protein
LQSALSITIRSLVIMFTACPTTALPTRLQVRKLLVHFVLLAFLLALQTINAAAEDKTDLVVMNNGDRFVGEIKSMDFGQLEFKASYMASSVELDWTKVTEIESTRRFRVEFADGVLASGPITRSGTAAAAVNFEVEEIFGTYTRGRSRSYQHRAARKVVLEPFQRKRGCRPYVATGGRANYMDRQCIRWTIRQKSSALTLR